MINKEESIESLRTLCPMGVRIVIDDSARFLSGLSVEAAVDTIKMDRSLIDDMGKSAQGVSLVSKMIPLAHSSN